MNGEEREPTLHRPWRSGHGRRFGFTLVELLIVIAIITLLACLLLPALRRAREAGKGIVCRNSIRQMLFLNTIWSDNNGKLTPYRMSNPPFTGDINTVCYWPGLLESVQPGTATPMINKFITCPFMTDPTLTFSAWGPVFSVALSPRLGGWEDPAAVSQYPDEATGIENCRSRRWSEIARPSDTAYFGDSLGPYSLGMGNNGTFDDPGGWLYRHFNKVQVGFLDGSVRALGYSEIPRWGAAGYEVFYRGKAQ